eukprot:376878-Pelagomonas_calceolata.AAC.5
MKPHLRAALQFVKIMQYVYTHIDVYMHNVERRSNTCQREMTRGLAQCALRTAGPHQPGNRSWSRQSFRHLGLLQGTCGSCPPEPAQRDMAMEASASWLLCKLSGLHASATCLR